MEVKDNLHDDIVQMYLNGRFDANTAPVVEDRIRYWIDEKGMKFIVIDMSEVPFIASAGLRVVLATTKELRKERMGDLRVCNLTANVRTVFEISGLSSVLKIFADMNEATSSFLAMK